MTYLEQTKSFPAKNHFQSFSQANLSIFSLGPIFLSGTKNVLSWTILILSGTKIILSGQKDGALNSIYNVPLENYLEITFTFVVILASGKGGV